MGVVHIAGNDVWVGVHFRQRCAWCGVALVDTTLLASPATCPTGVLVWPVGALVEVDGPVKRVVEHRDEATLPDGACANLNAEVTV
jgi:hypothetical protein